MPILNDITYYGPNDSIQLRSEASILALRDFDDCQYWYIGFFDSTSLRKAAAEIPLATVQSLRTGALMLVLDNSFEAFHSVVDSIYEIFVFNMGIPPDNITLISESATINEKVHYICSELKIDPIRTEWFRFFEEQIKHTQHDTKLNTLQLKPYSKKFLCLNRRWRLHRMCLVALLRSRDAIEFGYVSFAPADDNGSWNVEWERIIANTYITDLGAIEAHKEAIIAAPPLYLDTTDMVTNHWQLTPSTDIYYENTYLSVVNETNFFHAIDPGVFFSEKTFKPIMKKHPFILVSVPYSLPKLRELGYKTFDGIIDESYDSECDDAKRLHMIANEIERLSNMEQSELTAFLLSAKAICDYNYKVLLSKTNYVTVLPKVPMSCQ